MSWSTEKRKYALTDFTVEHRVRGWYFGRQYQDAKDFHGPYGSIASVTLMIARHLRKEVERRDGRTKSVNGVSGDTGSIPPC